MALAIDVTDGRGLSYCRKKQGKAVFAAVKALEPAVLYEQYERFSFSIDNIY